MLLVAKNCSDLSLPQLAQLYSSDAAVLEYLQQEFFAVDGAICCIWQERDQYLSALRLEPYLNGLLLTGLETAPQFRAKGYACKLLQSVIQYVGDCKIYSHVENRNEASLQLHRKLGFQKVQDYAKYIDGTVSANAVTLLLDIKNRTD